MLIVRFPEGNGEGERERKRKEQECCLVCDCKQQAVLSAVLPDSVNSFSFAVCLSLVMQEHQSFPSALCCWHRELRLSDSAATHTHTHTHTIVNSFHQFCWAHGVLSLSDMCAQIHLPKYRFWFASALVFPQGKMQTRVSSLCVSREFDCSIFYHIYYWLIGEFFAVCWIYIEISIFYCA